MHVSAIALVFGTAKEPVVAAVGELVIAIGTVIAPASIGFGGLHYFDFDQAWALAVKSVAGGTSQRPRVK